MTLPLLDCVELTTGHGQPRHAVIWLHGLGADGHDFAGIVPELNLPADVPVRFVFPHAPIIPVTLNHGYPMRAWYDILHADGIERKVDLAGIHASRQQIEALIAREAARGVSAERLVLAGFSQGGAMAYVTGLGHARPLAGVAALSTYIPDLTDLDALRQSANHATPVFAAHGQFDNVVPLELGQRAVEALRERGQPVSWRTYPMMHAVCEEEITELGRWLGTVLSAHPAG